MSYRDRTDPFGPGGDSTIDLTKITTMNSSFKRFIRKPQSTFTTPHNNNNDNTMVNITRHNETFNKSQSEEEGEEQEEEEHQESTRNSTKSIKRGLEEVIERFQFKPKRKTFRTLEEELDKVMRENLTLKVKLLSKEDRLSSEERNDYTEDTKPVYLIRIQQLEKELEDRDRRDNVAREQLIREHMDRERMIMEQNKRPDSADVGCQTNWDSMNIEKLLAVKIEYKKLKESLNQPQTTPYQHHNHNHQSQTTTKDQYQISGQTHNPIMKQMYYPPIVINNKQIMPDEKVLLEQLFKVNGQMTTLRDILKTKVNLT